MADIIDARNGPEPHTAEYEVTFSEKSNSLDIRNPRTGELAWWASGCGRGPLADFRLPPPQTRHIYLPTDAKSSQIIGRLAEQTFILVER